MPAHILQIRDPQSIPREVMESICRTLNRGDIIIHPTHTVMGMAVDTSNQRALNKLFHIKKRSEDKPVITICRNASIARQLANFPDSAIKLSQRFWPGPLTLALPARVDNNNPYLVQDGFRAIRVPEDPYSRMLVENYPDPLTTTSTSREGESPINNADQAAQEFGQDVAIIIDGHYGQMTLSTIVKCDNKSIKILREGAIPEKQILECLSE